MAVKHIPKNKWVTIGAWFGLPPTYFYWKVATDRRCSWRRIAVVPGWGRFTGSNSKMLWEGIIQIKSPVSTTCASFQNKETRDNFEF